MAPVIIDATILGNEKISSEQRTQRIIYEDQLPASARKRLQKKRDAAQLQQKILSGTEFVCSKSFRRDFKRIENFLALPIVNAKFIGDVLNAIEERAKALGNEQALSLVEHYREKLRKL